ncbi:MAG: Flp pilus assembly complex ATPase component TadA, partial [Elusimicrobia bacterium]|nr:Flp pilus assembly complex ATPase component TadA [Elusimicrobiota bacterium]
MTNEIVPVLKAALAQKASDVHLAEGRPPLIRVDGELRDLPAWPALTAESCKALVYAMLAERQRARLESELELDCSFAVPGLARFRANVLHQRGNVEAALRAIPSAIPTPEALGLGPAAAALAELPRGLVLVTGPTGTGKSTTLACLIERINATRRRHILTIEDPIEFVYPRRLSLV